MSIHRFAMILATMMAPFVLLAGDLSVSSLDSHRNQERRRAFSDWMGGSEFEAFVEEQKHKGKFPIYIEGNGASEYRVIFGEVDPRGWYFYYGGREDDMVHYNRQHSSKGLKLLTLSKSRSDRYSAVWISERSYAEVSAQLEPLGIGLASISD